MMCMGDLLRCSVYELIVTCFQMTIKCSSYPFMIILFIEFAYIITSSRDFMFAFKQAHLGA
jgi:hypothetical protein